MNTDEDFNIKFVHIVKKHRCLYDKKVPEYRNKDFQEKSWTEISRETKESVSHCKERWRNLRACLSRYIKQQSGTDPQHKPYYLTEHMQFLLPFLKPSRQSSFNLTNHNNNTTNSNNNIHLSETTNSLSNYDLRHQQIKIQFSPPQDESTADGYIEQERLQLQTNSNIEDRINQFSGHHNKYPNKMPTPAQSETDTASVNFVPPPEVQIEMHSEDGDPEIVFMSPIPNHHRKRMKYEDGQGNNYHHLNRSVSYSFNENTDMDFFRSILPDIDGMNFQQKRKFKIGVLELIDDVLTKFPDRSNNVGITSNNFWKK